MQYETDKILVVNGKKRHGKSECVRQLIKAIPSFFIYDPLHDYTNTLGAHIVKDPSAIPWTYPKIVFTPVNDSVSLFDWVAGQFFIKRRNTVFIVDELNNYVTPSFIPPELKKIINQGGHFGLGSILIAQRINSMNQYILSQMDYYLSYKQIGLRDLKTIEDVIGHEAITKDNEKINPAEIIRNLKRYWYITYDHLTFNINEPLKL